MVRLAMITPEEVVAEAEAKFQSLPGAGGGESDCNPGRTPSQVSNLDNSGAAWVPIDIFRRIRDYFTRYCVFTDPIHAVTLALWVMHTHVIDCFRFTPYVWLHSPEKRCGKTRVLEVAGTLCRNPIRTTNISESALVRAVEKLRPTLLMDEMDGIWGNRRVAESKEGVRVLLNSGYQRGQVTICCDKEKNFEPVCFDPFCPKILAGIGQLPDTIMDRSIPIAIHRKLKTQACAKFRGRDEDLARPIKAAIETWAQNPEVLAALKTGEPVMPDLYDGRREDIWEPLFAIAEVIGQELPELVNIAAQELSPEPEQEGVGATQLAALRTAIGDESGKIESAVLIDRLWADETLPAKFLETDSPNHKRIGHWITKLIKSYGGTGSRNLDFGGRKAKGYEIAELGEIFDRYCS